MNDQLPTNAVNTETGALVLAPDSMNAISQFADFMAKGTVMIPDHFQGKPADLAAVVIQSMQWGMNPYSVAQKTHLVSGTLGYEAQLVNAVITSSNAIQGRFHYDYSEGWEALVGKVSVKPVKKKGRNGDYTVDQPVADWNSDDERGLWVKVGATLRGESEIQWGEKLFLASILTRNSPLWITKPDQQISYLAVKYWSRLYTPQVILGVYTVDEAQDMRSEPKDITPAAEPVSALRRRAQESQAEESTQLEPEADDAVIVEDFVPFDVLMKSMDESTNMDALNYCRSNAEKYENGTQERDDLVAKYKARRAKILLKEDADKLAAKE